MLTKHGAVCYYSLIRVVGSLHALGRRVWKRIRQNGCTRNGARKAQVTDVRFSLQRPCFGRVFFFWACFGQALLTYRPEQLRPKSRLVQELMSKLCTAKAAVCSAGSLPLKPALRDSRVTPRLPRPALALKPACRHRYLLARNNRRGSSPDTAGGRFRRNRSVVPGQFR